MLLSLSIQNLVLIESLSLDFEEGFTVFTGETGAGKSMLLDAVGLLTGDKGDKSLLRDANVPLSISAVLAGSSNLKKILEEQGLPVDDECILRRMIDPSGRSKAFVNDAPVSLNLLKQIGEECLEVHGQMDRLLRPSEYRAVIDEFAGHSALIQTCKESYQEWQSCQQALAAHQELLLQAEQNLERLRFEREELENLNPVEGEETALALEREELKAMAAHHQVMRESVQILSQALQPALFDIQKNVSKIESLAIWAEKLDQISFDLSDFEKELQQKLGNHLNPGRLDEVEERLSLLRHLARKHKVRGDELDQVLLRVKAEIRALEQSEQTGAELLEKLEQAKHAYKNACEALSASRKQASQKLEALVQQELPPLKLEHATFSISLITLELEQGTSHGLDKIEFMFSANPGSPAQPLAKVASGGELSRLMLALKVVAATTDTAKTTIIFDEIDSGVGGAVASAIGARLQKLSRAQQVLSITHSPQVASHGISHYKVSKTTDGGTTQTHVRHLTDLERELEVARMLSGENITIEAQNAAKSLLAHALGQN